MIKYWPIWGVITTVLLLVVTCGEPAGAEVYTDSGHGDTMYGVNRSSTEYEVGSCAHCHDTFDDTVCQNPLMLFAANNPTSQTDNFCFQCHKETGSVQVGGVTNETYSANFGGGTSTFTTIYEAFNPASGSTPSSHNLADVLNHAVEREIGFTSETNACLVCHDQHLAQRNLPVASSGLGGVVTAIRRPIDYLSPGVAINLWGDEDASSGRNERMLDYTNKYQAPYYVGGTNYEPGNDSTADGSNRPNLNNFCLNNCHGTNSVYSTERGGNLHKINWSNATNNDEHGKTNDYTNTVVGTTNNPYPDQAGNYVLACTDCHEPHGSENEWLLRTSVNGKDNISVEFSGDWLEFCTACHTINTQFPHYGQVTTCWGDGAWNCHHHGAGGGMF
jgi:hypothetical protein